MEAKQKEGKKSLRSHKTATQYGNNSINLMIIMKMSIEIMSSTAEVSEKAGSDSGSL
jgi:hypothetical protein